MKKTNSKPTGRRVRSPRVRFEPEIRHALPGDAEAITQIFAGPRVIAGTLQVPFPSVEVWRRRMSQPEPGWVGLVACVRGELVGTLGIHGQPELPRKRHVAWIGMAVRDDWQGRGIGTALLEAAVRLADDWLQLSRLELQVFADNAAALRLYRRHGFEVEGTMRQAAFREGVLVDVVMMGRLRPARGEGGA